jgi:hypothetical protein
LPGVRERLIRAAGAFVAVVPLLAAAARADGPSEEYRVARASVAVSVLRDAIGVLTVDSGDGSDPLLPTYVKRGEYWVPHRRLTPSRTSPVSAFTTSPEEAGKTFSNYRFPITRREFGYAEIVVDPVKDARLWVNTVELRKSFRVSADYFARLERLQGAFVDPFFGAPQAERRAYMSPDLSAQSSELGVGLYHVRGERDGFLLLVPVGGMDDPPAQPAGWVPIRDADGLLTLWLFYVDDC